VSDKVFFSLPFNHALRLSLRRDKLTFWNDYYGRNVLTAKSVAQIGFDLCECACAESGDIATKFKALTGIELDEQTIAASKYAPVETKVFGTMDENAAVYSLGVFLRDLLISTGRSDSRLRAIFDKACGQYPFMRYSDFRELREYLAIYLRTEVDEEIYGVVIAADKPLPEPIFRHTFSENPAEEKQEAVCFVPYSGAQKLWHSLLKNITFAKIQIFLTIIFIVFASVAIPITATGRYHDAPTFACYETFYK
jgi:hypothetical protein